VPGLSTVLFADEYHRNWVEETDVQIDLERALDRFLSGVRLEHLPRYAMAALCIGYSPAGQSCDAAATAKRANGVKLNRPMRGGQYDTDGANSKSVTSIAA
jgi:hypothetical protein